MKISAFLVAVLVVATSPLAVAKTPPNPDRLDKIVDCKSALRELVTAAQGSPLRSAVKNQDYLTKVTERANRMCVDANPLPKPPRSQP